MNIYERENQQQDCLVDIPEGFELEKVVIWGEKPETRLPDGTLILATTGDVYKFMIPGMNQSKVINIETEEVLQCQEKESEILFHKEGMVLKIIIVKTTKRPELVSQEVGGVQNIVDNLV